MYIEEGEEIQAKVIGNIFNKAIAQYFPTVEKDRIIQVQKTFRTPNKQDQKRNTS
jgi:hypothetical protein